MAEPGPTPDVTELFQLGEDEVVEEVRSRIQSAVWDYFTMKIQTKAFAKYLYQTVVLPRRELVVQN